MIKVEISSDTSKYILQRTDAITIALLLWQG